MRALSHFTLALYIRLQGKVFFLPCLEEPRNGARHKGLWRWHVEGDSPLFPPAWFSFHLDYLKTILFSHFSQPDSCCWRITNTPSSLFLVNSLYGTDPWSLAMRLWPVLTGFSGLGPGMLHHFRHDPLLSPLLSQVSFYHCLPLLLSLGTSRCFLSNPLLLLCFVWTRMSLRPDTLS